MANEKPSLKQYLTRNKDGSASDGMDGVRRKMNKKSHKGRHYGGGIPAGTGGTEAPAGDGGAVGMGESDGMGMHNGTLPNSFTPNVISRVPNQGRNGSADTKKENRRNAPRKRSFAQFLQHRHRAEEEEGRPKTVGSLNDLDYDEDAAFADEYGYDPEQRAEMGWPDEEEPMNDFDRLFRNVERDPEYDQFRDEQEPEFDFDPYAEDPDAEYGYPENEEEDEYDDEFDDLDPEQDLDFDDENAPPTDEMDDEFDADDAEKIASLGTFADFYRDDEVGIDDECDDCGMDDEYGTDPDEFGMDVDDFGGPSTTEYDDYEEEQEMGALGAPGPGGFKPGAAVGPETATGRTGAIGGGERGTKIHRARVLFKQLVNNPDMERGDIINEFMAQLGVTESTAVSYYERLAKEAGMTNQDSEDEDSFEMGGTGEDEDLEGGFGDEEMEPEINQEEIDQQPPNRQGIIRQVDNAHLVYKRQMEDGSFEELWVFNVADKLDDALKTRRAILAGTDIPRGHTRSEDGQQTYTLSTMGNAQMLHITGLSN